MNSTAGVARPPASWLEAHFQVGARQTTVQRELVAGLATFMTMAYMIFVNPAILAGAGLPKSAVVAATCLGAALFLQAMFFAPLVGAVPAVATAPALLVVGFLMMGVVREMDLTSAEDGLPAFLTLVLIPLTQSISCGIGAGFVTYVAVKTLRGRGRTVSAWLCGIALLFAVSFAWGKN